MFICLHSELFLVKTKWVEGMKMDKAMHEVGRSIQIN